MVYLSFRVIAGIARQFQVCVIARNAVTRQSHKKKYVYFYKIVSLRSQ